MRKQMHTQKNVKKKKILLLLKINEMSDASSAFASKIADQKFIQNIKKHTRERASGQAIYIAVYMLL